MMGKAHWHEGMQGVQFSRLHQELTYYLEIKLYAQLGITKLAKANFNFSLTNFNAKLMSNNFIDCKWLNVHLQTKWLWVQVQLQ